VPEEAYLDDEKYRGLVLQMLETKAMALSKLSLWLEDSEQSIATLRDLHLREAHRWWAVLLERRLAELKGRLGAGELGPREAGVRAVRECALSLCKIRGLVNHAVDEENDLGEVRIVRAAAAGWDGRALALLVDAGAEVDSQDRNGRTAVQWAAIGGDVEAVGALVRCVCVPARWRASLVGGCVRAIELANVHACRKRNIHESAEALIATFCAHVRCVCLQIRREDRQPGSRLPRAHLRS
jgi:hypothetical protein